MTVVAVLVTLGVVALGAALAFVYGRRFFSNAAALPPPGGWPEEASPSKSTALSRLDELERLKRDGEIDELEYAARRRQLLR